MKKVNEVQYLTITIDIDIAIDVAKEKGQPER